MPLNIDWQQILLHLLNFAILAFILYMLLYSPIKKYMAKRKAMYEDMQKETQDKLQQAEDAKLEYQKQLDSVEQQTALMRKQAESEIATYKQAQMEEAKATADKLVAQAKKTANTEKQKILSSASKEIKELVTTATEKIATKSTSQSVDEFLDEIERSKKVEKAG